MFGRVIAGAAGIRPLRPSLESARLAVTKARPARIVTGERGKQLEMLMQNMYSVEQLEAWRERIALLSLLPKQL